MIKKTAVLFIMFHIFCVNVSSASSSEEIQALAIEVEKTNQAIDANSRRITESFVQLEQRVAKFSGELSYFKEAKTGIDEKYNKIIEGLSTLKAIGEQIKNFQLTQVKHEERLNQFKNDITRLEKEISVSRTIVTWVTAIVSVVVVLIGLFFSKRFLDLYSNYRVICSQYSKEKRDELGLTE